MATEGPNLFEHFGFSTRLWLLNHLTGVNSRMLLTLRAINDQARGNPSVVMTREQIARYWLASVSTVQRAIEELEQASLLICERSVDQRGQQANRYQIAWGNIRANAEGDESTEVDKSEDFRSVHHEPPPVHGEPAHYIPLKNLKTSSSLKAEAAEILKFTGLDCLMSGVQTAIENGATLADFEAIAEHYRSNPGKWDGPGAVYRKLCEFFPGQPIEKGWPEPSKKWLANQQRQQQAKQAAQQQRQQQAEHQAQAKAVSDLESRFGAIYEQMSDEDIWQVIVASGFKDNYRKTWSNSGRNAKSIRSFVLSQLELKGKVTCEL